MFPKKSCSKYCDDFITININLCLIGYSYVQKSIFKLIFFPSTEYNITYTRWLSHYEPSKWNRLCLKLENLMKNKIFLLIKLTEQKWIQN